SSRSFSIGSKIGYRHHQPRRPAFTCDARRTTGALAIGEPQIVGRTLATKVIKLQHSRLAIQAGDLNLSLWKRPPRLRFPKRIPTSSPPPNSCSEPAPPDLPHPSAAPESGAALHADSSVQCSANSGCANDW